MLTETELNLIKIMVLKGLDPEEVRAAIAVLITDDMEEKMLDYLKNQNPEATRNDIMRIISGRMKI